MKTLLAFVLLFLGCRCITTAPMSREERAYKATVLLTKAEGGCTGVNVGDVILTAGHCGDGEFTVHFYNGEERTGKVVWRNDNDLAAVKLTKTYEFPSVQVGQRPRMGEFVFTFHHPAGLLYSFSRGYVMFPDRGEDFQLDISGSYGSSGAGVFNSRGELVGIIHKFLPNHNPNIIFAVAVENQDWRQ